MPSRILRDWTDSLRFDAISAEAERLFVRLLMKADDYGRYHAEPRLLRAGCFPLENLRAESLNNWLQELQKRELVICYEVDGRKFLAVINFGQRLKQSRAKFPQLPGKPDDWQAVSSDFREVPGSSGKFPSDSDLDSDSDSDLETETEKAAGAALPLDLQQVVELWNASEFSKVRLPLSSKRRQALRARMKEPTWRKDIAECIARMGRSPFLLGRNDRGWAATFDWLLEPDSLAKVLEGKYDDRSGAKAPRIDNGTYALTADEQPKSWNPLTDPDPV